MQDELQRQVQDGKRRLQEVEQAAQEAEQLFAGTFYSSNDEVWNASAVAYNENHSEALRRSTVASVSSSYYAITVTAAENPDSSPRNLAAHSRNIFGITSSEIAHLIPASATNASLYDDVAAWTLALPFGTSSAVLRKLFTDVYPVREIAGLQIPV
jgi:hypothetical protein